MRLTVGMASQAGVAHQAGPVAVARMTVQAVLVLGRLVEPGKLGGLMTRQTSWRRSDALGTVGTVAAHAADRKLTMLRVCLRRMARRASGTSRRPGVRLMTF